MNKTNKTNKKQEDPMNKTSEKQEDAIGESLPVAAAPSTQTAGSSSPFWMATVCFGLPFLLLLVLAFFMRQS